MNDGFETEVKIRIPKGAAMPDELRAHGFAIATPRQFEVNTLYDTTDAELRSKGMILRVRQTSEKCVITWKGPGVPSSYKSRPELETSFGSLAAMDQILRHLGYLPSFRYEKYRTEFRQADHADGVVTIDETPIGDYLELEGAGTWIDETARRLGFSPADYILESYGRLYVADCERRGMEPAHMVFASHG